MIVLKRAVAKNCNCFFSFWILLDLVGFLSLIQILIPIVPWKICVKIAFFSWSLFLLWNILEPFFWPEHTGTGKEIHLQKDCQHIVGKKYSCSKSCMKKNGSISEKDEWRRLEGKNPTKWPWEKGSWRMLTLRSCQDRGSTKWLWDFYIFYKIMNALVWSFFD